MANEATKTVLGWDLVLRGTDEALVVGTDIGSRLGMTRSRDVRKLIERNRSELERFGPVQSRATVARVERRGRGAVEIEATEYLLNEGQALTIAQLSRAPLAAEIRFMLTSVFMAWRRGQVQIQIAESNERVARLEGQIALLMNAHPSGLYDKEAAGLRRTMAAIAARHIQLGTQLVINQRTGLPVARITVYNRVDRTVRERVGYPNRRGASWERATRDTGIAAFSLATIMLAECDAMIDDRQRAKEAADRAVQLPIDFAAASRAVCRSPPPPALERGPGFFRLVFRSCVWRSRWYSPQRPSRISPRVPARNPTFAIMIPILATATRLRKGR